LWCNAETVCEKFQGYNYRMDYKQGASNADSHSGIESLTTEAVETKLLVDNVIANTSDIQQASRCNK